MLTPATVTFFQVVLAIHIVFVLIAFGIVVAFPVIAAAVERIDRRAVPALYHARRTAGRTLVNPGLLIVVIAGVYLAAHLHQWHEFYVQWGIAAVVVLGALEGAFVIRQSKRLAEVATEEITEAGSGGEVNWSSKYINRRGRSDAVNLLMAVIVIVTCFLMVIQ